MPMVNRVKLESDWQWIFDIIKVAFKQIWDWEAIEKGYVNHV